MSKPEDSNKQNHFLKYTNGVFKVLLQFNGSRWYEETKHDG